MGPWKSKTERNENFLLVGILEELEDVLLLLERFLPHYFKGVLSIYKDPGNLSVSISSLFWRLLTLKRKLSGNKDMESPPVSEGRGSPGFKARLEPQDMIPKPWASGSNRNSQCFKGLMLPCLPLKMKLAHSRQHCPERAAGASVDGKVGKWEGAIVWCAVSGSVSI